MTTTEIPAPVYAITTTQPVSLRSFKSPFYEAICYNCGWVSYHYPTKKRAEEIGELHEQTCTERLNMELALTVQVDRVQAQDLQYGDVLLLNDLRTMTVEWVEVVEKMTHICYSLDEDMDIMTVTADLTVAVVR